MEVTRFEKILKALANRRRITILQYLKDKGTANVGDIARHIKLSFRSTSRHLATLYAADLVKKRNSSNFIYYRINSKDKLIKKAAALIFKKSL